MIDGLMSTGDVGHFDAAGRLFIDGRDDDMILSGGENVFPQEVEELLVAHDEVADAAVFGVPDEDFGQRLAAMRRARAGGAAVSEDELQAVRRERLARHKVPREIKFVDRAARAPRRASSSAASWRRNTSQRVSSSETRELARSLGGGHRGWRRASATSRSYSRGAPRVTRLAAAARPTARRTAAAAASALHEPLG